jgi:hypothetical protein
MSKPLPDLTPERLNVYETLERIRMAWVALWFVLGLFTITLLTFLVALFVLPGDAPSKSILGVINALLGTALGIVLRHLFPGRSNTKDKKPKAK